jgi:hypothetical protein
VHGEAEYVADRTALHVQCAEVPYVAQARVRETCLVPLDPIPTAAPQVRFMAFPKPAHIVTRLVQVVRDQAAMIDEQVVAHLGFFRPAFFRRSPQPGTA